MAAVISVGLFDAKTRLSEYVARAEAGEEVVIMRHNKPVAKLVPLSAPSAAIAPPPPFKQRTFDLGLPLVDLTHAGRVAADLEDEEIIAKMRRGA